MAQIFTPMIAVPLLGLDHLYWLIPIMAAIFILDRRLDGRFGVLLPIDGIPTNQNGEQTGSSNGG
jgi:hypothetical protein